MAAIKEWFGAFNVIFNWFEKQFGREALEAYWRHIADTCYDDVVKKFQGEGLAGVRDYFEDIFRKDGGKLETSLQDKRLTIRIIQCPAFMFMNDSDNPHFVPIKDYCRHDAIVNERLAQKSGLAFRMTACTHHGQCEWEFTKA